MALKAFERPTLLSHGGVGSPSPLRQNYLQIVPRIDIARNEPIIASKEEVQSAIDNDPLLSSEHRTNFKYIELSQYKVLSGQELELVQRLEVDMFDRLRKMGFVLFNPLTQQYLLMVGFDNSPIRDLIMLIEAEANSINRGINRAASQNGLMNGVLDGDIKNITSYLRSGNYIPAESELSQALSGIYTFNLEFARNRVLEEDNVVVPTLVEVIKVLTPDELRLEASEWLEGNGPLTPLVGMITATFPDEALRNAFINELVPSVGTYARGRLLEFMELTELFRWSRHSIDSLDKIGALTPIKSEQVSTIQLTKRELVDPLTVFFNKNPLWLKCWKEVLNYVINRLRIISEKLGQRISDEDAEIIKNYLLVEIGGEFRLSIKPTGQLTEA